MVNLFAFNNNGIRFEKRGKHIWVCLTDVAKASNKLVANWKQLKSTQEFLTELEGIIGIPIIESRVGGNIPEEERGTWAIQEVAIEFAGWCSVSFKIWMLDKIKTLMNEGSVSLDKSKDILIEKLIVALDDSKKALEENQKMLRQSMEMVSIAEEEKFENEQYKLTLEKITKNHPLFKNLITLVAIIRFEDYKFPEIKYTIKQILEMFPIRNISKRDFEVYSSGLYFLDHNQKPKKETVYKYSSDDLIYPSLILCKMENYEWKEIRDGFELDYKLRFPSSNRKYLPPEYK